MLLEKKTIELGDGLFIDVDPKADSVVFRIGEERKTVKKVDLWAACFTIADPATQEKLMPVRMTDVVTYKRLHNVQVKKLLKPGDIMKVMCEINVPQTIHEGLAGTLLSKRPQKGNIFLPSGKR